MSPTRLTRHIQASRAAIYRALLDAQSVQQWMVPDGMTSHVHEFHPHEGGTFRISLTYDGPSGAGKTSTRTDTFHGRFVRLVPDTEVVQVVEFETGDPELQGEMTITYTLADARRRHRRRRACTSTCLPGCPRPITKRAGGCRSTTSRDSSRSTTDPRTGLEQAGFRQLPTPGAIPIDPNELGPCRHVERHRHP